MGGTITVEQALKKGLWHVKVPLVATFIGFTAACSVAAWLADIQVFYGTFAGFVLGGLCAVLLSSYLTVRWRIWAFTNVDDVHELRQAAITEQLLPRDGAWYGKYEMVSVANKERLAELENRFSEKYVFTDDYTLPDEVVLYKYRYTLIIAGGLCILSAGVIALLSMTAAVALLFAGLALLLMNQKFVHAGTSRKPFITIGEKGLAIEQGAMREWKDISNERITWEKSGEHRYYYLNFDYPGGSEKINLTTAGIKTS